MTTLTTLEILTQARELLSDQTKWTQHALARDANGDDKPISHPYSDNPHWDGICGYDAMACSWCALGALEKVSNESLNTASYIGPHPARLALHRAAEKLYSLSTPEVNDTLGHAEVLNVYDLAIKDETATT
jgi:hypothetical protein